MIFQVVDIKIGTLGTKSLDVLWLLSLHGESSRLKIYGAWIVTTRSHQLPFVVVCCAYGVGKNIPEILCSLYRAFRTKRKSIK